MNILIFINTLSLQAGGPSRSVPLMAKGLAKTGIKVTLMTIRSDDMNIQSFEGSKVNLYILEKKWSNKQVENYINNNNINIIHCQGVWSPCYHRIEIIARKNNIAYIISPRGMLEPWSLSQKKWKKKVAMWLYQKKDLNKSACIYTTAETEREHIQKLGITSPVCVIPNGIDTQEFPCRSSIHDIRQQVLFLSRIHIKKGIELLLEAWNNIHTDFKNWNLLIVGNGEQKYIDHLNKIIEDMKLTGCIKIANPVYGQAKSKLYQESSLFCLPSYSENFGMVIAEAMSCGVPVITTTNCPWEFLNETKTGWSINLNVPNLENALREALSMSSSSLYEMGQKASILIKDNFDYKHLVDNNVSLYRWILGYTKKPNFVYERN